MQEATVILCREIANGTRQELERARKYLQIFCAQSAFDPEFDGALIEMQSVRIRHLSNMLAEQKAYHEHLERKYAREE